MEWFEGDIPSGINEAKKRNTLFVVYIYDGSDDSKKMNQTWDSSDVVDEFKKLEFVVMKFLNDSDEYKMFIQFYPVLIIPSVSFISGESGVLIEATAGHIDVPAFTEKIKKAAKTLNTTKKPVKSSPDGSLSAQTSPVEQASTSTVSTSQRANEESVQERAARLRKKMVEVHAKKEAQKIEVAKNKEIERRKVGQAMQKSQERRSDQEAKQLASELRMERMEDKLAKQKVREQITRDRMEKDARFAAKKGEDEKRRMEKQEATLEQKRSEDAAKAAALKETARIQFRMPDGSKLLHQFPSSATLGEAHQYVAEQVGDTLQEFSMSTAFPRRQFGTGDMDTTLLQLQLAPSAAIVILPSSGSGRSAGVVSAGHGGFFALLFAPIVFLWNLIYTFIFGTHTLQPEVEARAGRPDTQPQSYSNMGARPKSSYTRRKNPASQEGDLTARREGNIHRLNRDDDEDDDNNTWNGNSTQQM